MPHTRLAAIYQTYVVLPVLALVSCPGARHALWRRACVGCGEEIVIPLGTSTLVESDGCGTVSRVGG